MPLFGYSSSWKARWPKTEREMIHSWIAAPLVASRCYIIWGKKGSFIWKRQSTIEASVKNKGCLSYYFIPVKLEHHNVSMTFPERYKWRGCFHPQHWSFPPCFLYEALKQQQEMGRNCHGRKIGTVVFRCRTENYFNRLAAIRSAVKDELHKGQEASYEKFEMWKSVTGRPNPQKKSARHWQADDAILLNSHMSTAEKKGWNLAMSVNREDIVSSASCSQLSVKEEELAKKHFCLADIVIITDRNVNAGKMGLIIINMSNTDATGAHGELPKHML